MRRLAWTVLMLILLVGVGLSVVESACAPRRTATRMAFMKQTGFPKGRPGYVIDHIIPLACGGADSVKNMAWQTIAEAKEKDTWERKLCPPCAKRP